jgi:hypothetical protein
LKEEAPDRTVWRTGFGRGSGTVVKADCSVNDMQVNDSTKIENCFVSIATVVKRRLHNVPSYIDYLTFIVNITI